MKLLFCQSCYSIFSLSNESKSCDCGQTKGHYEGGLNAVYIGKYAIPLDIHNTSLLKAISSSPNEKGKGEEFISFVIPEKVKNFKKIS